MTDAPHERELRELRRKLANAERMRENADFHLGQEMARRQLAENEVARLRTGRADVLLEAADFLRDSHFRDGLSVQEIGTALRHMAVEARRPLPDDPCDVTSG